MAARRRLRRCPCASHHDPWRDGFAARDGTLKWRRAFNHYPYLLESPHAFFLCPPCAESVGCFIGCRVACHERSECRRSRYGRRGKTRLEAHPESGTTKKEKRA